MISKYSWPVRLAVQELLAEVKDVAFAGFDFQVCAFLANPGAFDRCSWLHLFPLSESAKEGFCALAGGGHKQLVSLTNKRAAHGQYLSVRKLP